MTDWLERERTAMDARRTANREAMVALRRERERAHRRATAAVFVGVLVILVVAVAIVFLTVPPQGIPVAAPGECVCVCPGKAPVKWRQ